MYAKDIYTMKYKLYIYVFFYIYSFTIFKIITQFKIRYLEDT